MIALDTNVIAELMRAQPAPAVVEWVNRQSAATLYLTTMTLAEIRFGLAAMPEGQRKDALTNTFENGIRPLFTDRILTFNEDASHAYARLRADARSNGTSISNADALITATVRAHDFAIATRDTAPFLTAGLRVINPFSPS